MRRLPITFGFLFCSALLFAQTPGGVSSNLHLWLKADAGVTGDPLTAWTDQSGNGFNATATSGPDVLTNNVNFNPTLSFDGTSDIIQVTNGIFGTSTFTDAWVFVINKTTTVKNATVLWESLSGGDRFGSHLTWGNSNVYYDLGTCCGSSRINTSWGTSTGKYHLWTLGTSTSTATPSGTRKSVWRDGLVIGTNNSNDSGTGNNNNFFIGGGGSPSHSGDVAEVIIYNGTPSTADLNKIHSYLSIKYGLTLDQSTAQAYFNSAGTNIYASQGGGAHDSYDNNITGIGRDDGSALDQRKSVSISGNGKVVMDKGGAFTNDMDFVLWGNDGGSLAVSATGAHPSYSYISQRNWKVDLSGTPGTVSVSFLLGGVWSNTGNPADYALIIDGTDTDYTSGATAHTTGATINGDTLTFTGVNFSDGDHFTLATDNIAPYPGGVVADLKIWLKGNSGITGTTNVTGWTDNGGYSNDMSETTGPELISAGLNFNPTLSFNGSNEDLVSSTSMWKTNAVTDVNIYIVAQTDQVKANSVFRETVAGSSGRFGSHLPWSDGTIYFDAGPCCGGGNRISSAWGGTVGEDYLWTMNGSTTATPEGNEHEIMRDGTSLVSDNAFSGFSGNGSNFYLGSANGSSHFEGEIAEIAIYEGTLTQTQQHQIHSYFAVKYGIQVPHDYLASSGSTIWDAAANAAYHNDVAGIGRDDDADLNQKQSISKNSGAVVTMGLGSIEVDNATNASTFGADESFTVWGNDNGQLESVDFTDLPTGISSRLERVWKVEETGTVGTLKVQIDMSTVPGVGGTPGNNDLQHVRLLVDADGTFASGATLISPTSFDNTTDIVEFDVDFPAGARFFTVGSTNSGTAPLPVELLSFEAEIAGDEVHLFWSTASEINNDHFKVQRSDNGKDFTTIMKTQGAGNSTSIIDYMEVDQEPLSGVSYYRLVQVDYDGTETISDVSVVNFNFPTSDDLNMSVFPNPATKDNININLQNFQDKEILIKVRDIAGKEYYSKVKVVENKNEIVAISIDENVPSGTYFVTASSDNFLFSKLIVITK
jgi:hypothetical protein